MRPFKITELTPQIGAVLEGVDLVSMDQEFANKIYALLLKYKVLFFQGQRMNSVQHMSLGRHFENDLSSRDEIIAGIPKMQIIASKGSDQINSWHTDRSWIPKPPMGAILQAINIPEVGGDTIWVDTEAAFSALSPEKQVYYSKLSVIHDGTLESKKKRIKATKVTQPLVRKHPDTGKPSLWASYNIPMKVSGVEKRESESILQEVFERILQPEFQVRYRWGENDIAFWDNRCTIHYAVHDYGDFPRKMRRLLIDRQEEPIPFCCDR